MSQPEASDWFQAHFGEHSLRVMMAIVSAGMRAHERSLEAKAGSELRSNDAYGTFWLSLREEMVEHLSFLPGIERIRPTRGRYELPVFNQAVIFSAKCPAGAAGPDRMKLRKSGVVSRIFDIEKRTSANVPLDFGKILDEQAEDVFMPLPGSLGAATELIFIAFDCTAQGGMQHVYVGEATLPDDGSVNWLYREELPLHALGVTPTVLTLIDEKPVQHFADAPLPVNSLQLLDPSEESQGSEGSEGFDADQTAISSLDGR